MKCAYCEKEIEGKEYSWIWFPADAKFKPVHPIHLSVRRELTPNEIQAEVDKRNRSKKVSGQVEGQSQ